MSAVTSRRKRRLQTVLALVVFAAMLAVASSASASVAARHTRSPTAGHERRATAHATRADRAKAAATRAAAAEAAVVKAKAAAEATAAAHANTTVGYAPTVTTPVLSPTAAFVSPTATTMATPMPGTTPTPTTTPTPALLTAPGSIYWGAETGTQFTGDLGPWDMHAETDFQNQDAVGKGQSIIPLYENFEDCSTSPCSPETFPWTPFTNVRTDGAIPMVSWSSQSLQDGISGAASDPAFSDAAVAAGDFDAYITSWAESAKAWGAPFFLRFDWEMNGNWFPWDMNTNGNTPADYVAAWRHVHDIFTKVGATNATWVWCPNVNQSDTDPDLASLYPGNSYVDWTCMDGYNWGTIYGGDWESFDQVAQSSYTQITQQIAPTKPMMIGEFNSVTQGGSRAAWLTRALAEIPITYPQIHAILLFDSGSFAIENDPFSATAFGLGINNPAYVNNQFSSLSTSPIPAP